MQQFKLHDCKLKNKGEKKKGLLVGVEKMSFSLKHKTRYVPAGPTLSADGAIGLPPSVGPGDCEASVCVFFKLVGLKIGPKCSFPVVKCD